MQDVILEERPQISADGKWWWNGREWKPSTEYRHSGRRKSLDPIDKRLLIVGYVFAVLPLLAFPGLLVQAGIGLGITNIIRGQIWHGVGMVVIAVVAAVAGTLIGGKGAFG